MIYFGSLLHTKKFFISFHNCILFSGTMFVLYLYSNMMTTIEYRYDQPNDFLYCKQEKKKEFLMLCGSNIKQQNKH